MNYIVCYDIESDRLRKKFHDKLQALGLERVQYSVFLGPLTEDILSRIKDYGDMLMEKSESEQDSIIMLKVLAKDIEKMTILGEREFDVKSLAGTRNTLFL